VGFFFVDIDDVDGIAKAVDSFVNHLPLKVPQFLGNSKDLYHRGSIVFIRGVDYEVDGHSSKQETRQVIADDREAWLFIVTHFDHDRFCTSVYFSYPEAIGALGTTVAKEEKFLWNRVSPLPLLFSARHDRR
jgi:hypothetical protein